MIVWSWPKNLNIGNHWKFSQGFLNGPPNGPWRAPPTVWGLLEFALGSGLPSHAMACLHDCPHGPLTLARIVKGLVEVPLVLDLGDYGKGPWWTPKRSVYPHTSRWGSRPVDPLSKKISGFAFSYFASYPEVQGITKWQHHKRVYVPWTKGTHHSNFYYSTLLATRWERMIAFACRVKKQIWN